MQMSCVLMPSECIQVQVHALRTLNQAPRGPGANPALTPAYPNAPVA